MAETPDSEMRERLCALCNQITVADEIDPEIQEELLGHMEDKFNAYLHGSESITEEDALILVREHFGDPAVVKALLRDTHVIEADISLGRRLAAACIAGLALHTVWRALFIMFLLVMILISQSRGHGGSVTMQTWLFANVFMGIGLTLSLSVVLFTWQRKLAAGIQLWFIKWRPVLLLEVLALLAAVSFITPRLTPELSPGDLSQWVPVGNFAAVGLMYLALTLQCAVWLWWCDRPPRVPKAISNGLLAWVLATLWASWPFLTVFIRSGDLPSGLLDVVHGTLRSGELWWSLTYSAVPSQGLFLSMAVSFLILVAFACAGRMLYWLGRRYSKWQAETPRPV